VSRRSVTRPVGITHPQAVELARQQAKSISAPGPYWFWLWSTSGTAEVGKEIVEAAQARLVIGPLWSASCQISAKNHRQIPMKLTPWR